MAGWPQCHGISAILVWQYWHNWEYWDALRVAVTDLEITYDEMIHVARERKRLGLKKEQIRVLHARIFEYAIAQFVEVEWLDDEEVQKLHRLHNCLAKLGWAPGQ